MERNPKIHSAILYHRTCPWVWCATSTKCQSLHPSMPTITFSTFGKTLPIPEYLCNSSLSRNPYFIVRKLMPKILPFNEISKVINCCRVFFLQQWNKFCCKKITIHHSTIKGHGKGYTTVRTPIRCDYPCPCSGFATAPTYHMHDSSTHFTNNLLLVDLLVIMFLLCFVA